ncbi:MAG: UvrD-helicase domain-containing protein, partial [Bacteroidales bacterium]|nr:UvrD-helicase domain-containing protein [Bacteroidales bacterium]
MNEKSLYIYKASAGAGKTFSLVVEYISILIENPANYAHILAVTFTNKATAEMKNRIMSVLYGLSKGQEIDYCAQIAKKNKIPPAIIQERAGEALQKILHDYSHFSIETIDSFFQRVLRNMTRELGIGASFNLLLDDDEIITEAIDATIDTMTDNTELSKWYEDFIHAQIDEGKPWNVARYLRDFAKNLNKETFKTKEADLENVLNRTFLEKVKQRCSAFCDEIKQKLAAYATVFEQLLAQHGYEIDDFKYGKSGALALFVKIKKIDSISESKRINEAYENPDYAWVTAKSKVSDLFVKEHIRNLFVETYEFYIRYFRAFKTAQLTLKNIHLLGLLEEIAVFKKHILAQQNSFLLSETANLLARIIQSDEGLDISFMYEKMGAQYHYIMIDEFQDTSHLNWENFKLLLAESLDNQKKSIIVGDAKQSIYRWNNGDWHIFTGIQQEFTTHYKSYKSQTELIALTNNFRTGKTIVEFNNELFTEGVLQSGMFSDEYLLEIQQIYNEDTRQIAQKDGGSIVCQLYDKESAVENYAFEFTKNEIVRLHNCGFSNKEITILCAHKKEIKAIIAYFAENPLRLPSGEIVSFVSDEAFMYRSALSVRLIIQALSYIANPFNTTALTFVKLVCTNNFSIAFNTEHIDSVLADRTDLLNKSLFDLVLYLMRQ